MFDFIKRKKRGEMSPDLPESPSTIEAKLGLFARLKQGLAKTRSQLTAGLSHLLLGKKELTDDLLNEIETLLLTADVGVETTRSLTQSLAKKLARQELGDVQAAFQCLQAEMKEALQPVACPLALPEATKPYVILVVGINGSGKTTTIGKMAHYFRQQNKQVLLAAGDTFRAAAIEQLQIWGKRNHVPVIAQRPGADTAAVIYDAAEAAVARRVDVLIADTAGRLHTQTNLMSELQKVKRVLAKVDPAFPHEVLLVLDAGLGQNAIVQVKQFHEAVGVTGLVLTKLDGTAKGGIVFALAQKTKLPIRFIGIGEGADDLRPFQADEYIGALFTN